MTFVAASDRRKDPRRPTGAHREEVSLMDGSGRIEPNLPLDQTVLPHLVKRALAYMRGNLAEKITLSDVMQACATSERTLLKQFKKCVGLSPLVYLRRYRLNAARHELLTEGSDEAITDIAIRCGYPHVGRFAGEYRRLFGESPSATRRRVRPQTADRALVGKNAAQCRSSVAAAWRERPSLVILPLRTETLQESLQARDLTEQLAATLAHVRVASLVLAHPSSPVSMNAPQPRNTGARYCLLGRLKQHGQRVRVTVRLVEVATDRHLWGDSFDGLIDNPLELQDRVADTVLRGITANITDAEIARASSKDPRDRGARELVLQAFPLILNADAGSAQKAAALLHAAIDTDPADATAAALLAFSQLQLIGYYGTESQSAAFNVAVQHLRRAVLLDNSDPLVLVARAALAEWLPQPDDVETPLSRALAIDPTSTWAWERRAYARLSEDADHAIADFQQALQLRGPAMARTNCFHGIACANLCAGRWEDADLWLRKALAENPHAHWIHRTISRLALRRGDVPGIARAVECLRRAHPFLTVSFLAGNHPVSACDPDWLGAVADAGLPL
jgi:AraC-like DNA-binding protein/TolB-like protein